MGWNSAMVHRRCRYPMFTISNMISYDGFMVQGMEKYGKADWFDVGGMANNKYVEEQGEFLLHKLKEMIDKNPKILDKKEKECGLCNYTVFQCGISAFSEITENSLTRYDEQGKPTNVGTVPYVSGERGSNRIFCTRCRQAEQRSGTLGSNRSEHNECCGDEGQRGVLYY